MNAVLFVLPAVFAMGATSAVAQNAPSQAAASPTPATYAPIMPEEVRQAERDWCAALVAISTEADTKGKDAAKTMANQVLDAAYAYDMGPVLFKPTLTFAPQTFRKTRDGALAYFVGGDPAYASDTGFALKNWRRCEGKNYTIVSTGNSAVAMGNVSFWNAKGEMTMVDKTFGYVRGPDGKLRIYLHHSSLPYKPG